MINLINNLLGVGIIIGLIAFVLSLIRNHIDYKKLKQLQDENNN